MSFDKKIESFIYLGKNKISISIFTENDKPIFKKDLLIKKDYIDLDHNAYQFIEKTILEFESKNKTFLKKTNVIIDKDYFLEINISTKDKINNRLVTKEDIEYLIFDLKKLVKDNNINFSITKIKIKNFRVDEKYYETYEEIPLGDTFRLEIIFEFINNHTQLEVKNFFSKLEIDIGRYFSTNYLELNTLNEKKDECAVAAKSFFDYDQNEVFLIAKNKEKKSFFEKLFHFFG